MTFFHCINCLVLAYTPFIIFYQASKLNQLGQFGCLFKTVGAYMLSSLVKMLLTATLANVSTEDDLSFINEVLYSCTNLIDAIALKYLLNSYKFDVLSRTELIALGWSAGEALFSKLMPLLIYSRSPEVDYKWIQFSLDASCDLVFTISFVLSVWMALCAKGKMKPTTKEFIFFGMHIVFPGLMSYLKSQELYGGWMYVFVHFFFSLVLCFVGRYLFRNKSEALKA